MRQHLIVRQTDALRAVEKAHAATFQKAGEVIVLVEKYGKVEGNIPLDPLSCGEIQFVCANELRRDAERAKCGSDLCRPFVSPAPVGVDNDRASMTRYHTG